MLKLSLTECQTFTVPPVDYEGEEARIRERNINLLYDLIPLLQDQQCLDLLLHNEQPQKINKMTLPNRMILFYDTYLRIQNTKPKNSTIVNKIRNEYHDLEAKIISFAERWGYEPEYVRNTLLTDEIFIFNFAKDPGKQTFHQHYAAKWWKSLPFIENFRELAAGGKNALYIIGGEVRTGESKQTQKTGKSIDFQWEYEFHGKALQFYATHKHTKEGGGAQDNQYEDVQKFHEAARLCILPDVYFISITDGQYYLDRETMNTSQTLSRLEYLNVRYKGAQNIATTTNKCAQDVIPLIIEWLQKNFASCEIQDEVNKLKALQQSCTIS